MLQLEHLCGTWISFTNPLPAPPGCTRTKNIFLTIKNFAKLKTCQDKSRLDIGLHFITWLIAQSIKHTQNNIWQKYKLDFWKNLGFKKNNLTFKTKQLDVCQTHIELKIQTNKLFFHCHCPVIWLILHCSLIFFPTHSSPLA